MTDSVHSSSLLGRSGHLLDLTIEQVLFEELDARDLAEVEAHVDTCTACARRLQAAREDEAALASALPESLEGPASAPALPKPANTSWGWRIWATGGAVALAAAAGVLVWLGSGGPDPAPETRFKGTPMTLEAFATDEADTWQLVDGDEVDPAWRVGFRVLSEETGHLWMIGIDAELQPYPVHPPDRDRAAWYEPHPEEPPALTAAVRFDTTPGMERIVALLCEVGISYEEVAEELVVVADTTPDSERLPELLPGCLQSEVRLFKSEGP